MKVFSFCLILANKFVKNADIDDMSLGQLRKVVVQKKSFVKKAQLDRIVARNSRN